MLFGLFSRAGVATVEQGKQAADRLRKAANLMVLPELGESLILRQLREQRPWEFDDRPDRNGHSWQPTDDRDR